MEQLGAVEKTPVMVGQAEGVKLLALFIPIGPQAAKTAGAVVQRIAGNTYFRIGNRNDLAFKVRKSSHGSSSVVDWSGS